MFLHIIYIKIESISLKSFYFELCPSSVLVRRVMEDICLYEGLKLFVLTVRAPKQSQSFFFSPAVYRFMCVLSTELT